MGNFEKDHDLTDSKYLKRPSSYFPFLKKPLNIILRRFCVRVGASRVSIKEIMKRGCQNNPAVVG